MTEIEHVLNLLYNTFKNSSKKCVCVWGGVGWRVGEEDLRAFSINER